MYKIGDKVIYQGADKKAYKRVGTLKSIEEKDGKPQLTVEFDDGETFTAPVDDWSREFTNACTSTNSVVRNAMAANRRVARNAAEIRPGEYGKVERVLEEIRVKSRDALGKLNEWGARIDANSVSSLVQKLMQQARNRIFG